MQFLVLVTSGTYSEIICCILKHLGAVLVQNCCVLEFLDRVACSAYKLKISREVTKYQADMVTPISTHCICQPPTKNRLSYPCKYEIILPIPNLVHIKKAYTSSPI